MNYLKNALLPKEIRNDINTLKSGVSELNTRLTGLEKAQQALNQQVIKTAPIAKKPTLFEPNDRGSLLDQIKKGKQLNPAQPKKTPISMNNIRPNDVLMNAIAERMRRQRQAVSADVDWED